MQRLPHLQSSQFRDRSPNEAPIAPQIYPARPAEANAQGGTSMQLYSPRAESFSIRIHNLARARIHFAGKLGGGSRILRVLPDRGIWRHRQLDLVCNYELELKSVGKYSNQVTSPLLFKTRAKVFLRSPIAIETMRGKGVASIQVTNLMFSSLLTLRICFRFRI